MVFSFLAFITMSLGIRLAGRESGRDGGPGNMSFMERQSEVKRVFLHHHYSLAIYLGFYLTMHFAIYPLPQYKAL